MRLALALLLLTGCYPEPQRPSCRAETGIVSDTLECPPLERHERVAGPLFGADLPGWTVVVRTDVRWSEKYQRLYFTEAAHPGWLLWGMTDHAERTLYLADENLARAVLAHEECHAHHPTALHEDWPNIGCADIERAVAEQLAQASGVYEPQESSDGVYDPGQLWPVTTGASGGER